MANYVKSELYRISRSKGFYIMLGIVAAIALSINVLLLSGRSIFPDTTVSSDSLYYSLGFLIKTPMLFCYAAMVVTYTLYEGNQKNGNLKNSLAFGISRTAIFGGKALVASIATTICLAVGLVVYLGSALALLKPVGPVTAKDVLLEVLAIYWVILSAAVLSVWVMEWVNKSVISILIWLLIFVMIPTFILYGGMALHSSWLVKMAMWCPSNFLQGTVTPTKVISLWAHRSGLIHCWVSGLGCSTFFLILGAVLLRKKALD